MTTHIRQLIERLAPLDGTLHDNDFLATWTTPDAGITQVLTLAEALSAMARAGLSCRVFESGLGVSIFRDKSTRTRYAFKSGCDLLGLRAEELEESTSQVSHGETTRETAAMVGFLSEVMGIRDDMFIGEGHRYMQEVAASLDEARREGVLLQRTAVINLQSDLDHPTQSMADVRHLCERFGSLEALRGKKIAMTWAYSPSYGKPLSVPQGVVALMARLGMKVTLAHPEGYQLMQEPLDAARAFAQASGGSFETTNSLEDAFRDADIVYPKSWAPYDVMVERTRLLRSGNGAALPALEKQALAQNAAHTDWECDEQRMALTRGGQALYMHCLPADVSGVSCKQGEVSKAVFEKARIDTYHEASHKPFVIAAMILATRCREPSRVLEGLLARAPRRAPA